MSSQELKDIRVNLRLDANQKDLIEKAAELNSQTVTSFALEAILKKSRDVIKEHQQTLLSLEDANKFIEILEMSEEPNEALVAASIRYEMNKKG